MKIKSVTIATEEFWASMGMDGAKEVTATFEDDTTKKLFSFYSDEIQFTEAEFVGLTETEAKALHYERDMAWLRS